MLVSASTVGKVHYVVARALAKDKQVAWPAWHRDFNLRIVSHVEDVSPTRKKQNEDAVAAASRRSRMSYVLIKEFTS